MPEKLQITYEVDQVQCDISLDDVEVFFEHIMRGTVTFVSFERSFKIERSGVLRLSRSLIRLCTFPVMYGLEAHESVLDQSVDLRSTFDGENVSLEIVKLGQERDKMIVLLAPSEALQIAGKLHLDVLLDIFRRCPNMLDEHSLHLRIPDAFALAMLARTGKIGSDSK